MDAASAALDLDGLDVAELKALLLAKDSELIATRSLIASKDELLRAHALEIQALKLHILKLKQLQFGKRSEKRERQTLRTFRGSRRGTPSPRQRA